MDTSLPRPVTSISGIDKTVSFDRVAELFIHRKIQSVIGLESGQPIGINASRKLIDQLLDKLELYHECAVEANAQLRRKTKASMSTEGQYISTERQKDIEICTSIIILAYNNMVGAIFSREHKLMMKTTDDVSFSMQYSRIIENAVQCSIEVTNQFLNFSLLIQC